MLQQDHFLAQGLRVIKEVEVLKLLAIRSQQGLLEFLGSKLLDVIKVEHVLVKYDLG